MFMAASYATYQGGKAIKHKVERRKNAKLDGDFIIASSDPTKNRRRRFRDSVREAKQSFSDHSNIMRRSIQRIASSVSSSSSSSTRGFLSLEEEDDDDNQQEEEEAENVCDVCFVAGQEVELQNMDDECLNGTKALVLQDYDDGKNSKRGILVQFLVKKDGYDNYHESGIVLQPENIASVEKDKEEENEIIIIPIGTWIELQNLNAIHMNGLRGIVVHPSANDTIIKKGRVAVQLFEGDEKGTPSTLAATGFVISVKAENCKIIVLQEQQQQQQQQPSLSLSSSPSSSCMDSPSSTWTDDSTSWLTDY